MCGILGIYFQGKDKKVEETLLKEMCNLMRHRGPDDEGYCIDGNIGIGMRRLSVIDLVGGHQPIHNEDQRLWVISNGEIYNFIELKKELIKKGHRFYTHSDTEVIVHLYENKGVDCLKDLSGMFAFAVFDKKERKLFIARDRIGVKPVYYYHKNGEFLFASELKVIQSYPDFKAEINPESLYHFFSLNYVPAPQTILKEAEQLLAGHYLIVSEEGLKIVKYWDVPFTGFINDSEDAIVEKLLFLIEKSVKGMLKADVPLGAFLSGGMDSSAVVSFMRGAGAERLKTFSVGFKEDSYDESYFAKLAAERFNTEHYQVFCEPNDLVRVLPKIVWHADNLLADPSMLPLYLVSKIASEQVTVCLSGDGGDELFAGYPTYTADTYLKKYGKIPSFFRQFIIERVVNSLPASSRKLSFDYKAKKFIEGSRFHPDKAHYWWRTVFTEDEKKALFSDDFLSSVTHIDSYSVYADQYHNFNQAGSDDLEKYFYADFKVWLPDDNLIRVDAMSMAHSLEVRVPFLDHELVEFMFSLEPELKMKGGKLKYLLKRAMKDKLPEEIIKRKKAGWHLPLAGWFRVELKDYLTQVLSDSKVINAGFFNKGYIDRVLNEHFMMQRNNSFKIWGLLLFFQWYKTFFDA